MSKFTSSRPSNFSTATVKPSFFSNSLEAFSKESIFQRTPGKLIDLSQINFVKDEYESGLINRDRWLRIHKQQQDDLSAKLERPPQCLVMNADRDGLYINQEKRMIFEASKVPDYCDKYRGHPNFWKTSSVEERGGKSLGNYEPIQFRYDRSNKKSDENCLQPAQLEYVGIPDAIYKEKELLGRPCAPTPKENWDKSEYVLKKKEHLKEKLKLVQEHVPELAEIAVVGRGLNKTLQDTRSSIDEEPHDKSSLGSSDSASRDFVPLQKLKTSLMSVLIGDKLINDDIKLWTIQFDNCLVDERYETSIVINNLDKESSMSYVWEMVVPHWADNDMPLKHIKKGRKFFYFNKNVGVMLPQSKKEMMFYFQSNFAGVHCEKWKFLFSHAPDKWECVIVELEAVATERPDIADNLRKIDTYLESCKRYIIARKTVQNILDKSQPKRHNELPYDWNFSEEQIFVYNNPDLSYDNKNVLVLKQLYEQFGVGPWDYSVESLRKQLLQISSNENMKEELDLFTSTIYHLIKPNLSTALVNEKKKSVYELLCCFANKIEAESANLKVIYRIPMHFKNVDIDNSTINSSVLSAKLSAKVSQLVKKNSGKKSSSRTISVGKISNAIEKTLKNDSPAKQSRSDGDSVYSLNSNEFEIRKRKQEYLEAMYVKTYYYLGQTIDQISAIIDSFDAQIPKTALSALKDCYS